MSVSVCCRAPLEVSRDPCGLTFWGGEPSVYLSRRKEQTTPTKALFGQKNRSQTL